MSDKFNVNLSKEVDKLIRTTGGDIVDAICHWCMINNVELETAAELIKKDPILRAKIQMEAEDLNFLTPSAKLPI